MFSKLVLKVEVKSPLDLVPTGKPLIRLTCRYREYLLNLYCLGDIPLHAAIDLTGVCILKGRHTPPIPSKFYAGAPMCIGGSDVILAPAIHRAGVHEPLRKTG